MPSEPAYTGSDPLIVACPDCGRANNRMVNRYCWVCGELLPKAHLNFQP